MAGHVEGLPKGRKAVMTASTILLVLASIAIAISHPYMVVKSDFNMSSDHVEILGFNSKLYNEPGICSTCHGGLRTNKYDAKMSVPVESTGFFEDFRCMSCHLSVTPNLADDVLHSAHNVVGCIGCHDVYHVGHKQYKTDTPGLIGCHGKHFIMGPYVTPPPTTDVLFVPIRYGGTNGYLTYQDRKTIFITGNASKNWQMYIFTLSFIDPATGSFADIPRENRTWICMKCHFILKPDMANLQFTRVTQTTPVTSVHPDNCYKCHSPSVSSGLSQKGPHDITKDNDFFITSACSNCHTGVAPAVDTSVHSSVGCRCHTVTHISRYIYQPTTGFYSDGSSWSFMFRPPPQDTIVPTIPQDFLEWLKPYHYDATNASALGMSSLIYPQDNGIPHYLNMSFIMRGGDASLITSKEERFMTCLNCHMVSDNPSLASFWELVEGKRGEVAYDPHSITESIPGGETSSEPVGAGNYFQAAFRALGMAAVAAIILVFYYTQARRGPGAR